MQNTSELSGTRVLLPTMPAAAPVDPHVPVNAVDSIERIVKHAVDLQATDIHLEPCADAVEVRIRWGGTLLPLELLPKSIATHLVGRLKTLAQMLAYRKDLPQEGWIPSGHGNMPCDVRIATYPTSFGERVAMRLGSTSDHQESLENLGMDDKVRLPLERAFDQSHGVILMSGPSGSGKTTTLYSCLRYLVNQPSLRTILTIEDPIERRVSGVTQTQVNPAVGLTFARALRSLLRQDPEVLLVGEIRDRETASTVFEAGLTGHLVASTIHAGTAPQVYARLLEMDVEPFVLTTALRGVIAQRLLRRRCSAVECGEGAVLCMRCNGMGYVGSVLVSEWLAMSPELRRTILDRGDGIALSEAALAGQNEQEPYVPMRVSAEQMVRDGITTQEELDRVLGDF